MEKRAADGMEQAEYKVWVGEKDQIASFHAVDTYQLQSFACRELYLKYLRALQECGFRFQ